MNIKDCDIPVINVSNFEHKTGLDGKSTYLNVVFQNGDSVSVPDNYGEIREELEKTISKIKDMPYYTTHSIESFSDFYNMVSKNKERSNYEYSCF